MPMELDIDEIVDALYEVQLLHYNANDVLENDVSIRRLEEQLLNTTTDVDDVPENDAYVRHLEEQLLDATTITAGDVLEHHVYVRHPEEQHLDGTTVIAAAADVPENEASQALVPSTCSNTWPSNCYSEYQIILNSEPPMKMSRTSEEHNSRQVLQGQGLEMVTNTPIQVSINAEQYNNSRLEMLNSMDHISGSAPQTDTVTSMYPFDQQSLSNIPLNQSLPTRQFTSSIPHNVQVHHQPHPMNELNRPQVPSSFPVQMTSPILNQQFNLQQNITQTTPYMQPEMVHLQPNLMPIFPEFSSSSNPFHAHSTPQNHIASSVRPIHQYNPQPHHDQLLPEASLEFSSLFNRRHLVHQPLFNSGAPRNVHTDINKGKSWTEEEHRLFLIGLQTYRKGNWKKISENVVKTRTPIQIASHAQKFFDHQINKGNKKRRRRSIHDITNPNVEPQLQHQNQIVSSSLPMHQFQSLQSVNPNSIFLV